MRKCAGLLSLVMILLFAGLAVAMDLQSAKKKGLVGETPSGYLAVVQADNAEAKKLTDSINAKRRQHYQQIAKKNKTSVKAVEQLAGKTAIDKTPGGQYVKINGKWKKK